MTELKIDVWAFHLFPLYIFDVFISFILFRCDELIKHQISGEGMTKLIINVWEFHLFSLYIFLTSLSLIYFIYL